MTETGRLHFPDHYFENETRYGFTITAMMKRYWAAQMEVLAWVDEVCTRNDIRYIMCYGSLIGTVRHHGYIPWDDDIDIAMLREDFTRFSEIVQRELPPYLITYSLLPGAKAPKELIFGIFNGSNLDTSPARLERFHGCPYAAGLDMYVFDKMPQDPEMFSYQERLVRMLDRLLTLQWDYEKGELTEHTRQEYEAIRRVIGEELEYTFTDIEPVTMQILRLMDVASALCEDCDSHRVENWEQWIYYGDRGFCTEHFTDRIFVPYEGVMDVPIPRDYDTLLRNIFGEYRIPRKFTAGHPYPSYRNQREQLYRAYHKRGWEIPREFLEYGEDGSLVLDPETLKDPERRLAVFLPYKAAMWDALETIWRQKTADPAYETMVIPIPYYDKAADGSLIKEHWEFNSYPADVPVVDYRNVDLEELHPAEIYIHNPYDQANHITSVHPDYYAKRLKDLTDQLVYVPYFVLGDTDACNPEGIADFAVTPGVFHAHRVIVQSEEMKQAYVSALVSRLGEDTREIWERKIEGTGSPKLDRLLSVEVSSLVIPAEWERLATRPDGSRRMVILYNTGIAALLAENERMIDKIRRVLEYFFAERENVTLLWRPHPLIEATLTSMRPQLSEEYRKIVDEYVQAGWGIYDDTPDLDRAILWSDAYYGDPSSLVWLYRRTGKPVMIQNVFV